MENEYPSTAKVYANGMTLEVDLEQMLMTMDPEARHLGYDHGSEEDRFEAGSLASQIVEAAAALLVTQMKSALTTEIAGVVRSKIEQQVSDIVKETLEKPIQKTTDWGAPKGEAKPLAVLIKESADEILNKPSGDRYSSNHGKTVVTQIIANEVTKQFTTDLKAATEKARKQALEAVEQQAAAVIRETITRAARGL